MSAPADLVPLRVLDLAGREGAYCARMLADLGADVVKLEPPGGDPSRALPPFIAGRSDANGSVWWLALNANKRSIVCDLASAEGRALFHGLIAAADVLVESFAPGHLDDLGLDDPTLWSCNDRLIHTSITPYGSGGPLAATPASDLEVTAMSGALWLAGEPDDRPVRTSLPQSGYWAGMYAAAGTLLAALARPDDGGGGQRVDVSAQASMATVHAPAPLWWDVAREDHGRTGAFLLGRSIVGARFRNVWRCKDGFVSFALQGGPIGRHTGRMLTGWMAARGETVPEVAAVDWDAWDPRTLTSADVAQLEDAIAPFFLGLTKAEFFAGSVERNMLGYPVSTTADIAADAQLAVRGFWQELPRADGASIRFPGGFALFDGERPRLRRGAPRVGEHDAEIRAGLGQA